MTLSGKASSIEIWRHDARAAEMTVCDVVDYCRLGIEYPGGAIEILERIMSRCTTHLASIDAEDRQRMIMEELGCPECGSPVENNRCTNKARH